MDEKNTFNIEDKIISVLTGQASQEELQEVRQWLSESDGNRKLYDDYAVIWETSRAVSRDDDYRPDLAWTSLRKRMKPERHSSQQDIPIRKVMMVAAMVAVVFLAGMAVNQFTGKTTNDQIQLMYTEYSSPYGSKSKIRLPDGSVVWLNAGSTLRYSTDFNVHNREVYLEGEGYFDVKTNPDKPFTVHTSHLDIQAFGTAFNIKAYPEDATIVTTLEHGELKVNGRNDKSLYMTLKPMQNVVYYKNGQTAVKQAITTNSTKTSSVKEKNVPVATVSDDVNISLYTSWKDSEWLIESQTFGELAGSLERRFNIRMVFGSNELKNYRFSGTIRNETIEQVLNALTITAPVKYTIDQGIVRLQIDPKRKSKYDTLLR